MESEMADKVDVFVIGGGVNGCGIARDAVGRGYSVALAEMNDLASGTSSWSSKLIHGGLRYLEHYEFRLVREALGEREILLKAAPHIIWPMRFILPHHKALRPAWLLRLGLYLYDYIGKRKLLPPTKTINLKTDVTGKVLKPLFSKGFEYSDCWVNDARLVVLNAKDAQNRGANIQTRTKVVSATRQNGEWNIITEQTDTGERNETIAKILINAAGPWVDNVLGHAIGKNNAKNVRLVQGSHIVVPKLHNHDRAYIFQNADGRIIFALPYEQDYTLIGTTDQDYDGDPADVKITQTEITYLCEAASEYFQKPIVEDDIVWTYSGVRPLYDDGASAAQEATRDYVLKSEQPEGEAAVINIFGGKITTFRRLAESMLEEIEEIIGPKEPKWTEKASLPGGDFEVHEYDSKVSQLIADYPFLEIAHGERLVRSYGTLAWTLLGDSKTIEDLGQNMGHSLTERELRYLISDEWALSADDVLWRRTKLGIRFSPAQINELKAWFSKELSA
jgi:glycerol-3-phosphate dehydrogenase